MFGKERLASKIENNTTKKEKDTRSRDNWPIEKGREDGSDIAFP